MFFEVENEFAILDGLQPDMVPDKDVQWSEHYVQRRQDKVQESEDEPEQREDQVMAAIRALQKGQDEILTAMRALQRRQDEILAGIRGCRKTIESDRPPRYFILVPPVEQPLHKKFVERINPFSKAMDMYFICQSSLVELKSAVKGDSAARSIDYTLEFSEPIRVKQPTVFVKKHRRALTYGMAILRICVYGISCAVGLGIIVPVLNLEHYEELVEVLEHGVNLVDVADSDELIGSKGEQPNETLSASRAREQDDSAYESLCAFLKKRHDNDWKVAVKKTLRVVTQGEKCAYVCKANKSHEMKWTELKSPDVVNCDIRN